jgi:serine protease Do
MQSLQKGEPRLRASCCDLIDLLGIASVVCFLLAVDQAVAETYTAEQLAARTRPSIVTLTHKDRNGDHNGMGTGFVIDSNGLIATSLHVIGEARPVQVRFASGKQYDVESIHAWDRKLDLAVIKIDATDLEPLRLGDSDQLRNGQPVVAVGNPMGLEQSIVAGVVSGIREFEHSEMIQLAIPIEPGNSGGPLLDMQGRVHGLLNLKSTVTENLGFATPVSQLKLLLAKPNTVPIERWLRIGALRPDQWNVTMGAHWSQVTGRIKVTGTGDGFGGRALCLRREEPDQFPYEMEVSIKLKDESGAAGLVFGSNGGARHFGFYPSNGQIRLTRFDGENVFSWNILHQIQTPFYRSGDWNHLLIRHTSDLIEGYLNGHLILTSKDRGLPIGKIGLAKFRETEAEFKGFRFSRTSEAQDSAVRSAQRGTNFRTSLGPATGLPDGELLKALLDTPDEGQAWLLEEAQKLELEAKRLRQARQKLHRLSVSKKLSEELGKSEDQIDLLRAALLVSKHDNPDVSVEDYLEQIRRMADEILESIDSEHDEQEKLTELISYLFHQNGFHGSYFDYRNNANSYLDNVIDDREGLPITLSVLFLELGRRIQLDGLSGFPLPYHFLVKHETTKGDYRLIDVFNSGESMTYSEADNFVSQHQKGPFRSDLLVSSSKKEIINRMLRNLLAFTQAEESLATSLPYLDLLITLNPSTASFYLERAWIHLRSGNSDGARHDLQWILDHESEGINIPRVREALESL